MKIFNHLRFCDFAVQKRQSIESILPFNIVCIYCEFLFSSFHHSQWNVEELFSGVSSNESYQQLKKAKKLPTKRHNYRQFTISLANCNKEPKGYKGYVNSGELSQTHPLLPIPYFSTTMVIVLVACHQLELHQCTLIPMNKSQLLQNM